MERRIYKIEYERREVDWYNYANFVLIEKQYRARDCSLLTFSSVYEDREFTNVFF